MPLLLVITLFTKDKNCNCATQVREEKERLEMKVDELQQQLDTERDNASTELALVQADRYRQSLLA